MKKKLQSILIPIFTVLYIVISAILLIPLLMLEDWGIILIPIALFILASLFILIFKKYDFYAFNIPISIGIIIQFVTAIALIIGCFDVSSEYYIFLKIIFLVGCSYALLFRIVEEDYNTYVLEYTELWFDIDFEDKINSESVKLWNWENIILFIVLVLMLFNVFIEKSVWQILDILCAFIMLHKGSVMLNTIKSTTYKGKDYGLIIAFIKRIIWKKKSKGRGYVIESVNPKDRLSCTFLIRFENGSPLYFRLSNDGNSAIVCSTRLSTTRFSRIYQTYEPAYKKGDVKPFGNIIIPSKIIDGDSTYTVSAIGNGAFEDCTQLFQIQIPDSVQKIGHNAFMRCEKLKQLELPSSIQEINYYTFKYCSSLQNIKIPESIQFIGEGAFEYCKSLREIELPPQLNKISECMFSGCLDLQKIDIPNTVHTIEYEAFKGCSSLHDVKMKDAINEISPSSFEGCELLQEIVIPNGVQKIGTHAFYGCKKLERIVIPPLVNYLYGGTFIDCSSLREVFMMNNNIKYERDAFPSNTKIVYK